MQQDLKNKEGVVHFCPFSCCRYCTSTLQCIKVLGKSRQRCKVGDTAPSCPNPNISNAYRLVTLLCHLAYPIFEGRWIRAFSKGTDEGNGLSQNLNTARLFPFSLLITITSPSCTDNFVFKSNKIITNITEGSRIGHIFKLFQGAAQLNDGWSR